MTTARYDPDEVALLEEERDFLLRSLDDLERERAEGSLADDDYDRLRDDYTARAAAVIRSLEQGADARPVAAPVPPARRVLTIAGVTVFALVAALLLGRALGERLPGETVTGNEQLRPDASSDEPAPEAPDLDALEAAAEAAPDDPAARMAYADGLLDAGRVADALREYDEVARLDPGAAEPRVRSAFIVFNAGLVDEAMRRLDAAETADPTYDETYFVRGVVLLRGREDRAGARAAFERYLEVAPDGEFAEDARVVLAQLDSEATEGNP